MHAGSSDGRAARRLRQAGCVVLRALIPHDDAIRVAATAREIREACNVEVCRRPNNALVPMRWNAPALSTVLGRSDRMQRVREASGGDDLRWLSAYLSIKEPGSGPLPWHQDWWCWDHPISFASEAPQVALLCYLDAASRSRGALRVLPGSHHRRSPLHDLVSAAGSEPLPDDPVVRDQPGQVTIEVAAGDAVLIDYRLLHGTHENWSDGARSCLIINFAPGWRTLPSPVRGHLIQSWGLPDAAEWNLVDPTIRRWLPTFTGIRCDLPLSRVRT